MRSNPVDMRPRTEPVAIDDRLDGARDQGDDVRILHRLFRIVRDRHLAVDDIPQRITESLLLFEGIERKKDEFFDVSRAVHSPGMRPRHPPGGWTGLEEGIKKIIASEVEIKENRAGDKAKCK